MRRLVIGLAALAMLSTAGPAFATTPPVQPLPDRHSDILIGCPTGGTGDTTVLMWFGPHPFGITSAINRCKNAWWLVFTNCGNSESSGDFLSLRPGGGWFNLGDQSAIGWAPCYQFQKQPVGACPGGDSQSFIADRHGRVHLRPCPTS